MSNKSEEVLTNAINEIKRQIHYQFFPGFIRKKYKSFYEHCVLYDWIIAKCYMFVLYIILVLKTWLNKRHCTFKIIQSTAQNGLSLKWPSQAATVVISQPCRSRPFMSNAIKTDERQQENPIWSLRTVAWNNVIIEIVPLLV